MLLVAAATAFALANSPLRAFYTQILHAPIGFQDPAFSFQKPLEWFVNDGLMTVFFFTVGLEIRRETREGVLSEWRRAVLPLAGALGGMIVPAILYLLIAGAPPTRAGWGTPMATDIAFALGILALLGKRVPDPLRILLLALAVIDDLGAIVVIALFYSKGIAFQGLLLAGAAFVFILILQRLGVRPKWAYAAPALLAWVGVYHAGIHPTIAGVILGIMTPPRRLEGARRPSPARSLDETLHPWIALGVMPLFALVNAGVHVERAALGPEAWRVMAGVSLGLVFGKPLGVFLACTLAVRLRLGALPAGIGTRHLVVLGSVAGIGFTMAIFIAQLAFPEDEAMLAAAKTAILAASALAALGGLLLGRLILEPRPAAKT